MPAASSTEPPSVPLSFSNNFWGKDDAGVGPLLERMHNAKTTCDELKAFYSARAALEEDYSKKLLSLARKGLGSSESGTLRLSLDVVRAEVESMGKAHANIASQMRSELDEPLAAFAGAMKERRKIVQIGIEKLHKTKSAQTSTSNKARDKYENDCLKVKGYLAQGHMVMGHEERKNKAKLEKTQIQMSSNSNEYEGAIKVLEETTGKWNREWKAACDKFQDLEEERIDFLKSSLWTFANIASTVCVSDDASCEKMRLSLEDCDVEKDIMSFIKEKGTGQEIPDPPKFIDFCRGDVDDSASEASRDEAYSVAQFPRAINPTVRSSSPQPSVFDSHHDPNPNTPLAQEMGAKPVQIPPPIEMDPFRRSDRSERSVRSSGQPGYTDGRSSVRGNLYQQPQMNMSKSDFPEVPHDPYPPNGMTQFCRTTPNMPPPAERSAAPSPNRPPSRDSTSEVSQVSSMTSYGPSSGQVSPVKQMMEQPPVMPSPGGEDSPRKRGFFNSPFHRKKSKHGRDLNQVHSNDSSATATPTNPRNTWSAPPNGRNVSYDTDTNSPSRYRGRGNTFSRGQEVTPEPEPVDPRARFQLNVGNNVFDVSPDGRKKVAPSQAGNDGMEMDPIAAALEELKGVTKNGSVRVTADRYAGLATPAPGGMPTPLSNPHVAAAQRGTPPPAYDIPVSRLGAPPAAHTARAMKETTKQFTSQKENMFGSPAGHQRGPSYNTGAGGGTWSRKQGANVMRATSPGPPRATSPRPDMYGSSPQQGGYNRPPSSQGYNRPPSSAGYHNNGRVSPNPQFQQQGGRPRVNTNYGSAQRGAPPARAVSPQPHFGGPASRPVSRAGGAMQLASPTPEQQGYGTQRGRPQSMYGGGGGGEVGRVRSKSVADPGRMVTRDGKSVMHYARAMYMYQAQIPEELGFAKGDMLAVLRHQDDGWWEAEVCGKEGNGRGLVPSNYLQAC